MKVDSLAPPRPELLALLDAVKDHPDEDTPRLVLADWLDEQDDPLDAERAAFIRADIAHARRAVPAGQDRGVFPEPDGLRARWLGPVAALGSATFARGLPVLHVDGARIVRADVPPLLATEAFAFVDHLHLSQTGGPRMEALVAVPEFRHVAGVRLHPFRSFGSGTAARVFGSPNLTGLRFIEFWGVRPGVAGMHALAANPALARLRKLALGYNDLVDKAVAVLTAGPHLTNLQVLDLSHNNIGDGGAVALAAAPHFTNLRKLNLRSSSRLTRAGKDLLRAKFGDRVELN